MPSGDALNFNDGFVGLGRVFLRIREFGVAQSTLYILCNLTHIATFLVSPKMDL